MLQLGWIEAYLFAADPREAGPLRRWALRAARTLWLAGGKFRRDFCFERAGSLTFATIISLIPLSVLFVSIAGSLGGGEQIIAFVQREVFQFLAPEHQKDLEMWLDRYISRKAFQEGPTGLINLVAVVGLFLASLGVMVTAERVFNRIWRTSVRRGFIQKATVFWVILSTSPLLIVVSITVAGFLVPEGGLVRQLTEEYRFLGFLYGFFVPSFIGFVAFTLLFLFLPCAPVRIGSAAIGGLVSAVFWELSKGGFDLYVIRAATVTNFYRQIAAVPLFLIWLYVTWAVTLWGGQISYVHQHLEYLTRRVGGSHRCGPPRAPSLIGLVMLREAGAAFCSGRRAAEPAKIASGLGTSEESVAKVVESLVDGGLLAEDARDPGHFRLARHPDAILLRDVVRDLEPERLGRPLEGLASPEISGEVPRGLETVAALIERAAGRYLESFEELTLGALIAGGSRQGDRGGDGSPDSGEEGAGGDPSPQSVDSSL